MKTRVFPAEIERWDEVLEFLDDCLETASDSETEKNKILIASEEIFTNIASYAYESESGDVEITCSVELQEVIISMKDWGIPYDLLEHPDPSFDIPFENRRIGGLGIYMVKKFMDRVEYRYENGCNIVTIGKKL